MSINESLLRQFESEAANTRKLLERVPDDRLDYKPHEKSLSLGQLAAHLAELAGWLPGTLAGVVDTAGYEPPNPGNRDDILDIFDRATAVGRDALESASDEDFEGDFTLRNGEQVIFSAPKMAVVHNMVISHAIHHRGQLTVYLRLNDVPLPAIYGPSADENPF